MGRNIWLLREKGLQYLEVMDNHVQLMSKFSNKYGWVCNRFSSGIIASIHRMLHIPLWFIQCHCLSKSRGFGLHAPEDL